MTKILEIHELDICTYAKDLSFQFPQKIRESPWVAKETSRKGQLLFIKINSCFVIQKNRCFCAVCRGNRRLYRRERARHALENGTYLVPASMSEQESREVAQDNDSDYHPSLSQSDNDRDSDIPDPINDDDAACADVCTDGKDSADESSEDEISNQRDYPTPEMADAHSNRNPLTRFLFSWASKFALGDKAMNTLMQGLTEVECTGGLYLPKDFRTVHRAFVRESEGNADECNDEQTESGVTIKFFCEACCMHEFQMSEIDVKQPCIVCNTVTVKCAFKRCSALCVATSRLGNRSIHQLTLCPHCDAGPRSPKTTRIYFYDLHSQVQRFFRNPIASKSALASFHVNDNEPLFTIDDTRRQLIPKPGWHGKWIEHINGLKYKSECWHGSRFFGHPIWKEHGMRSLLLSLFIDWFPPFKKKGYSVGVVSCAVLNLPSCSRNAAFNVWPIAIIEGPGLLHSTYAPFRELCQQFESFFYNGIRIRDSCTNSVVTVHGVIAQVIGDCPALAKIGMHNGPSSYFSCHRCGFKGVICGHDKSLPDPARFDNVNFKPSTMKEIDRELLAGSIRKKSQKEHIVWLETDLIAEDNLRENSSVLSDQFRVWEKLTSSITGNWSQSRMNKWTGKFRVNGLSPLVHIPHLSLVNDLTTESMHFFIKGILLQLADLTFSQKKPHNKKPYNINRSADIANKFMVRMQRFKLPLGVDSHQSLPGHVHFAKAEPLYTFLKVQALLCLEGLVNAQTYECWRLMSVVCCGLLHTHVPKWWIDTHLNALIKQLAVTFKNQFGECEMRLGWHFLLHARVDFQNWSTSRSHWAFPGERFCGALIRQVRNASSAKITPSLVRNSTRALAAMELYGGVFTEASWPSRSKAKIPTSLPESLHIEVDAYLKRGYQLSQKGVGYYNSVWKVDDFVWLCDHNDMDVCPTSRLFKVAVILRPINEKSDRETSRVLVLRRLDKIRLRKGYNNVFAWSSLDPMHSDGLVIDTSRAAPSVHMCEAALFQSSDSGTLFVPICGNLAF